MASPRKFSDPHVSSSRCFMSPSKCPESLHPTNHQWLLSCHTPPPSLFPLRECHVLRLPSAPVQPLSGPQATKHYSTCSSPSPPPAPPHWLLCKHPKIPVGHSEGALCLPLTSLQGGNHREHMTKPQTGCGDQKPRRGPCCPPAQRSQ